MLEKIKKLSRTKFERTNFKAFSFFLIFSLLIWVLVQFSKTYEENIRIPIDLVNVPKDKIMSGEDRFLKMKLEENGFKIAWFALFRKDLKVDLSQLEATEGQLVYDVQGNSAKIRQTLELNAEDVTFLEDKIFIDYQQKAVKTVPVKSRIQLDFQPGYDTNDTIRISPDSIKISGPKKILNSIKMVETIPLTLKKVDGSVSGSVAIDTAAKNAITFYANKVNYSLTVEKFTEGKLEIPISVINAPEDMEIILFPKTVQIIFKVSLQNYEQVSKSDFRIVCDYSELEEGQQFFIPKVVKRTKTISNLRININKIEFIIKK